MSQHYKYPRTPHLPWSPGAMDDDVRHQEVTNFEHCDVVVTEKMDGENTTLYTDHIHARSLDSRHHPSRDWVKQFHATIARDIPIGWRICGENIYAQHSVHYQNLRSYFYAFSIWNEENICLSWPHSLEWFNLLGITTPDILYQGPWNETLIRDLTIDTDQVEGYVVRRTDAFHYTEFSDNLAKWVRPNHVQTDEHWMSQTIVPNELLDEETPT